MTKFEGAKCAGLHWLFDSTFQQDHKQAKAMCKECPALLACRDLLKQELNIAHTIKGAGGGPRGTWAGRLVGKHERQPWTRPSPVDRTWYASAPTGTIVPKDTTNASAPRQVALERRPGASPTMKDTTDV